MKKEIRPSFFVLGLACLALLCGATCRQVPEDSSAFAATAGEATMALGGCMKPLTTGWESCIIEKGAPIPKLRLFFTNPAEYFVSDCEFGVLLSGSVKEAGEVIVDTTPLAGQIAARRFCILDVEAVEHYPDQRDKSQKRSIPLIGGFYIQVVDPGYMPIPSPSVTAWCKTVRRTNKGRTVIEDCK